MSLAGLVGAMRMPTRLAGQTLQNGVDDLEREAQAVLDRAAVDVGALVRAVAQELVDQIAVGAVDLDAVEARALGAIARHARSRRRCRRSRAISSARGSEVSAKPLSMKVLVLAAIAEGATGAPPSGCSEVCEMRPTCHICRKMRPAASCTALGHRAPAFDLRLGEAARRPDIALALLADLRGFGDQQAGARALAVIERRERARHGVGRHCAIARQRRHRDAVRQCDFAELERRWNSGEASWLIVKLLLVVKNQAGKVSKPGAPASVPNSSRAPRSSQASAVIAPSSGVGVAHQDFGAVAEPAQQHQPVGVADRDHQRARMERDLGDAMRTHAAFARRLAHRPVLVLERPDDAGVGARGREPVAVVRPGQRARLAGIAGHAHVAAVGEPPAVQRVLLHRGDEEAPVRRDGDVEMRALPFQQRRLGVGVGEPERDAVVMGEREPIALGQEGEAAHAWSARVQVLTRARRRRARAPACRPTRRSRRARVATASIHRPFSSAIVSHAPAASVATTRPSSPPVMSRSPSSVAARMAPSGWAAMRSPSTPSRRLPSASASAGRPLRKAAATTCSPASSGATCCGQRCLFVGHQEPSLRRVRPRRPGSPCGSSLRRDRGR